MQSLLWFIRLSPGLATLEGCDLLIKLNIKLDFCFYTGSLIDLFFRMCVILLIIGLSCVHLELEQVYLFMGLHRLLEKTHMDQRMHFG